MKLVVGKEEFNNEVKLNFDLEQDRGDVNILCNGEMIGFFHEEDGSVQLHLNFSPDVGKYFHMKNKQISTK